MLIMLLAEHDIDGGASRRRCISRSGRLARASPLARQPISASWHGILQSESSQANRSASRFHFGGFAGRNFG